MKSDKNKANIIRYAKACDRDALYKLWQDCFHDSDIFTDYYFDYYFRENRVLMLEEDGALKAMLHLNPYAFCMDGQKVDSYYIVGVATDKAYRHRGAMTRLLKKAFEVAYARQMPFVYLMPADEAIYRPFQFAYVYVQQVEEKRPHAGDMPEILHRQAGLITCRPAASEEDMEAIADMANDCLAAAYDLYTWRDSHYFDRLKKENQADGGDLLMLYAGDQWIGYMSYAREKNVEVREIYCQPKWRKLAAAWFMQYFEGVGGEVLPLAPEGFLAVEKQGAGFFRPIIMGRIIHLSQWILQMPVGKASFSICLEVEDRFIEENCGVWQWQAGNGQVSWQRTEKEPDIWLNIDDLLQWLTGYWPLDEMEAAGLMTVKTDCRDELKKIPVLHGLFINEIV